MGYSKDFKDKVIEIMTRDQLSVRKAAQHFGVCTRTIQLWKKSTENRPIPGCPAKISKEQILKDVEQYLMIILVNRLSVLVSVHMQYLMRYMPQEYRVKKDVKAS
ncbi:IS630 transposase-related protein [Acinetobacter sp. C_3_1]|uniref:Transposase Synechocystis PCC 6803 domain-containing protein n=2 Tax=Moraxellaceae TaxID=468 RepID=A0A811GDM4_9GAMM|nr:IS630 transposase-related protein [Acinetobacter sp. C_3_1]CAB1215610.1 hypothetical protein SFB21_1749 [Acinetobacter bouvetii]